MIWIIIAAVIWVFILFFIQPRGLKKYWTVAIWSILLAYFLNETFVASGFYVFQDIYYPFRGLPLAYIIASAGKGIVIIRYLPEEKWWQLIYLILFAAVITGIEYLLVEREYLLYFQWTIYESLGFRLIAFITLAWLSKLTIQQQKNYLYR